MAVYYFQKTHPQTEHKENKLWWVIFLMSDSESSCRRWFLAKISFNVDQTFDYLVQWF